MKNNYRVLSVILSCCIIIALLLWGYVYLSFKKESKLLWTKDYMSYHSMWLTYQSNMWQIYKYDVYDIPDISDIPDASTPTLPPYMNITEREMLMRYGYIFTVYCE